MEAKKPNADQLVQSALDHLKKHAPEEHTKLQAELSRKQELIQAVRLIVEEQLKLAEATGWQCGEQAKLKPEQQLRQASAELARQLPERRMQMIKRGLKLPTYRLDIKTTARNQYRVEITRNARTFMPTRDLTSMQDLDWTSYLQSGCILLEGVLLLAQAAGLSVEIRDNLLGKAAKETAEAVERNSVLEKGVLNMREVWEKEGGSSDWEKAAAFFRLLRDSHLAGVTWGVMRTLYSHMTWWEWLKAAVVVTAMVEAAQAAEGNAVIATIATAVDSACELAEKLQLLKQLQEIREKRENQ